MGSPRLSAVCTGDHHQHRQHHGQRTGSRRGTLSIWQKNTRFATMELVEEYFDMLMDKYTDGKMQEADFIKTFSIAFPCRPEEKVHELAVRMSNKNGEISMANMLILFYLFSDGKL